MLELAAAIIFVLIAAIPLGGKLWAHYRWESWNEDERESDES